MKAIIYCRKSTDRSDRQQLSIEAQEKEARRIALKEWLEIVEVFKETMSAKEPWRPLFNKMMSLFNSWKADCIITWKLNRLARNPIDEWTIKWSIQSGIIKAIYTESEAFKSWDNVLIMWMHFWMSTQYILDLQRDIKRWMKQKIENWWVCQKAPLWYINNKLEKTIEVAPIKSEWIKEIFELRTKNHSIKSISRILFEKWIKNDKWLAFAYSTIEDIIKNKFYLWLVLFKWEYYKWNYETFISKKLYDKANSLYQWFYEYKNIWIKYPLKWYIKDSEWIFLDWYTKKWINYYKSRNYSPITININENKLLDKAWEILKNYEMDETLKDFNIKFALKILENWNKEENEKLKIIDLEIKKLNDKKKNLLDLRLEWEIDKIIYNEKSNDIILKINDLEIQKNSILNRSDKIKITKNIELGCSLYNTYKQGNNEYKTDYLRKLFIELFINKEKELSYAESPLLKLINFVNFKNGGAKRVWTAVYGVADRCMTTLPWHQI